MKAIAVVCLALLSVSSIAGYNPSERYKDLRQARLKVTRCAIELIEGNLGEDDQLDTSLKGYVDKVFVELKEARLNIGKVDDLYYDCKYFKNNPYELESMSFENKNLMFEGVLESFFNPRAVCTDVSINAAAGFFPMLKIGSGISYCSATNGKRFLALTPQLGVGAGAGLAITFEKATYVIDGTKSVSGSSFKGDFSSFGGEPAMTDFALGIGWATNGLVADYPSSEKDFVVAQLKSTKSLNFGAIMYGGLAKGVLTIKVLPLPRGYSQVLKQVMQD